MDPARGQVYWAEVGGIGRKPWLVVSNNRRNKHLQSVLAVRITTTDRHAGMPTVVPLSQDDPLVGYVVCDDLGPVYRDEIVEAAGALSGRTMLAVNAALRVALGIAI
ncbi:type II toxin-antitoxin system PemK/MazF family toxin [Phytohabitans aurantiacus]|uniref:Endoribonuclease MazF1 n=1 Tax=Phytohabitans aurantiacus TaxID=3016789 RepID=A0ABQ5QVR6_9ACTN|nr:type II toxin-antitoxin system PemK/MazF family toxin [Phytohabitans aurantiacus]GLH98357.1 endoribonuclease MazF1 [Phytohabitans aurantiacus]